MAASIFSILTSKPPLEIKSDEGVFAEKLKVSRVSIHFTSTVMRHMKEDGSTVVDSRVIQPISLSVDGFCPDKDTLSAVNEIVTNRSRLYKITSKEIIINDMIAESDQIKQSSDFLSAAPVHLSFRQLLSEKKKKNINAQSADSSVVDRGMSMLNTAKQTVSGLSDKIKGLVHG